MNDFHAQQLEPRGRFPRALNTYLCTHLAPIIGRDAGVKALDLAGITHLGDLICKTESDIKAIRGIGPVRARLIAEWVRARGFELGRPDGAWQAFAQRCRVRAKFKEQRWIKQVLSPQH